MKIDKHHSAVEGAREFKDVYIVPQYSEVTSRSQVDTSVSLRNMLVDVPVISANMDTVTDSKMAIAIAKAGGIGALHRFMTIEENVRQCREAIEALDGEPRFFVSIGVNEDSKERAVALFQAGARAFVIDIAHGHSKMMKDMMAWTRDKFGDEIILMAGNVATPHGVQDLQDWGADLIKVGIGPGAVCTTKNVTGVTVPQFSAVVDCAAFFGMRHKDELMKSSMMATQKARQPVYPPAPAISIASSGSLTIQGIAAYLSIPAPEPTMMFSKPRTLIVADGGITEIGDIAKALGAGADLVMCGRLFASCHEAPGERINGKKVYRGMASRDAMLTIKKNDTLLPTPEGVSTLIETTEDTVANVISQIKGGLQSAFSYSNSRNLKDFQQNVKFGLRQK